MKLYRYMSVEEFVKMSLGMDMQAYNFHFDQRASNSEGFCFIGERTFGKSQNGKTYEFTPEETLLFLSGIVNDEILVEFEVDDEIEIKSGYGKYANPYEYETMQITEYSLMKYNKNMVRPVRYILNPRKTLNNGEMDFWEDFSEKNDYSLRDLANKIFQDKIHEQYDGTIKLETGRAFGNFKYLPPMPNTSKDEIWRVITDYEQKTIRLIYGNPITEENRYELKFNPNSKTIDFGETVPEFWKDFKDLYDNGYKLPNNYKHLLMLAVLTAEYPQLLKTFSFESKYISKAIGYTDKLKSNDPNQPYELDFDLAPIRLSQKEDGTIDIVSCYETFGESTYNGRRY